MIHDPELVRKNMKFMRELYGVTQKELAEVLNVTQHGISQYETGKRSLCYEQVQILANYFRIPIEQFVKEDLSEVMVLNPSLNLNYILDLFETMFPIFCSEKALEDKHFKKGYDILLSTIDASKNNRYIYSKQLDICIESFVESYNTNQTMEAIANALGFMLLIYAPAFDKEKTAIATEIYKENVISKKVIKKHILRNEMVNDPTKDQFIEENSEFILDGIRILKKSPKWAALGDYYLALRYIIGVVDNEYNDDMNALIGEELMSTLVELKNKYASAYWNKKYGFLLENE